MAKNGKRQSIAMGLLTNLFLMAVVFVLVAGCGFIRRDEDAVSVNKSYRGVIYAGNENSGKVALMINVYWGTEYLMNMLDILKEEDVKCTFFVGESWVKNYPAVLRKIYEEGHEIGNHGSNHKEHSKLSKEQNALEIQNCTDIVQRVTGVNMNLFAPPGGSYSNSTVQVAESLGYKTILWTHDTIDWRDQDEELIFSRATGELASGDLILMHPTKATENVLRRIIQEVKSKKLTLDTVSNTIKE